MSWRQRLVGTGAVLLFAGVLAADTQQTSAQQGQSPQESVSIGYWTGGTRPGPSGAWTEDQLKLAARVFNENEIPRGAPFEADVVAAENLPEGERDFLTKGAKVTLRGVFAAGHQWSDNDLGTFLMNIGFKPYDTGCQKVSSVSFAAPFVARRNELIPAISTSFTVGDRLPVDSGGLKLSFDLVDVADDRDKGVVKSILDKLEELPPFKEKSAVVLGAATGPFVVAASAVVEILGQKYLPQNPANKVIWSRGVETELTVGSAGLAPKLRRGVYFVGGRSRLAGGLPAWGEYQLRAADVGNTGEKRYLYRRQGDRVVPADFTYVILDIDFATQAP